MQTIAQTTAFTDTRDVTVAPRRGRTTGVVLSTLAVLFLTFDSIGKLLEVPAVIEGSAWLGYPGGTVFSLGVLLLVCVAVYVIPRTSVFGAVLLTGYLGGAVATHVRVESPLFTHRRADPGSGWTGLCRRVVIGGGGSRWTPQPAGSTSGRLPPTSRRSSTTPANKVVPNTSAASGN